MKKTKRTPQHNSRRSTNPRRTTRVTAHVKNARARTQRIASAKEQILAECAIAFGANSDDCNKFVKAIGSVFFEPDLFTGPNMNADAIVSEMRTAPTWSKLGQTHTSAIRDAKEGLFVIAGMTSTELGSLHGHLAIVVGDDGQNSGNVLVPICYAGSLNPSARVQRKRVSETFGSTMARESKISYFSRLPQTLPQLTAVDRLLDYVSGIRVQPDVFAIERSKTKSGVRKTRTKTLKPSKAKGNSKKVKAGAPIVS